MRRAELRQPTAVHGRQLPVEATATVRDVFSAFVEANAGKVQALFDRVAESDPAKALDLLARFAEFVIPKLARTDLSGDPDKTKSVTIRVVGVELSATSDPHPAVSMPANNQRSAAFTWPGPRHR